MSVLDEVYREEENPLDAVYGEAETDLYSPVSRSGFFRDLTAPITTLREAYKVSRISKKAGLREGLTPWTPDILAKDVELDIEGQKVVMPGWDVRLKEKAEEIQAGVDQEMQERISKQLAEGKLWPVHKGQPWYKIDPGLMPEVINTWAANVGDQAAVMVQTLLGQVVGGISGRVLGTVAGPAGTTVGGFIGGHVGGAIPNIANETAGYMHDAEFWGITDKEIMEENARYYGISAGLMEYAQNAVELAASKGMLKLGVKETVKRNLVIRGLKEFGINVGEGLTEVSQDGLERFFLRRAAEQMKIADPNFKTPDIPDTFAGWKRTFAQAAGTAAILRGGGHAASRTMQHLYAQQKVEADQATENVLMEEPQPQTFRPEPRVMPQADVTDIGTVQLQAEGEVMLTAEEQATLDQLEAEPEVIPSPVDFVKTRYKKLSSIVRDIHLVPQKVFEDMGYHGYDGVYDPSTDAIYILDTRTPEEQVDIIGHELRHAYEYKRGLEGPKLAATEKLTPTGKEYQAWIMEMPLEEFEKLPVEERAVRSGRAAQKRFREVGQITEEEHMIIGGGERGVVEPGKPVKPRLYIGNVTPRAKEVWAEILNMAREVEELPGKEVSPKELGPHKEGPFATKRTEIELTVDEARNLEGRLTEAIDERLAEDKPFSSHELALLKAAWGDVKELRKVLGLPTGRMPFRVIHAGKVRIAVVPNTVERIYTGIEGPNKRILADLSYSDLLTEEQGLNAAMKKAAVAAKHAFSVGAKEAVAKLREHIRELKRKRQAIRMAKNARKALTKELMRKTSNRIDPYYRQAIRSIVNRVDPVNRSQEIQRRMDALQAAIQRDPSIADRIRNPNDLRLLKRAEKVPLNRMSTRQLEALVDERRRLHQEGKLKARRTQKIRKQQETGFIADAIATLANVPLRKRLAPGQEMDNATWFQKMWNLWRGFKGSAGFGTYRMDRMMEYLDGFKRGFFTHIWEKIKSDTHTSRERRSVRVHEFVQAMKDTGIDGARWMLETLPLRKSDGTIHKLTPWQMLGVYIQSRHATGKIHLIEGNKFSEQDLNEIAKLVEADPKLTAMHHWIVNRQQAQWKALVDRLRAIGIDPTKFTEIKEYLPLMIADLDMVEQDDILQKFLGQFMPQELLPKGFLKERHEGARQPIELDAMMLYMHSIDQVEHMMAMAPILNRLGKMLNNPNFRKALNDVTYNKGADIWKLWLMDIGRDRVVREQMWYDQIVHYLQRNSVLYAIGWNLPSVLKQIPALFVGLAEDPRMVTFLIDNMMALSSQKRFEEFRSEARKRSSVLRHRNIEPELRAMWNRPHLQAMMKRQFGRRAIELDTEATSWMRMIDDWLTTLAWKCRYDAALSEGYDEQAAIRLSDQTVQKTQQMASPEDLPHLFRGGTIASILNLFQNQGNQELNYWVHDIYGKVKRGKITPAQAAWRVMMATILPITVYNVVSHGGGRDEDEEGVPFIARAGGYMFGNLPVIGNIIHAMVNGYGGGADLWEMPMEGIQQTWSGIRRGKVRVAAKGLAKVIAGVVPTKGLINAQAIRTIEGAYDLTTEETEDKRRLVWSKAMLEEEPKRGKSSRRGGIR